LGSSINKEGVFSKHEAIKIETPNGRTDEYNVCA